MRKRFLLTMGDVDPELVCRAMVAAARAAGDLLMTFYEKATLEVEHKGVVDLVSEADKAAEAAIMRALGDAYPSFAFLCEESGASAGAGGGAWQWRFIVDPLDGTTSFVHGHPHFSVSIACEARGQGICAAVVYNPTRDEMYTAVAGRGAYRNGARIHVSKATALINALFATGFSTSRAMESNALRTNVPFFHALLMACRDVRRNGSAALDLCFVACGRMDFYWEMGLKAWDIAAGHLILLEAGGTFTDLHGRPVTYDHIVGDEKINLVGSNGLLHAPVLQVLQQVRTNTGLTE